MPIGGIYSAGADSAADVAVDTSAFAGNLSSSDDNVQDALDTLDDLTTGSNQGEANVQADWDETDTADDSFIRNKPTIPTIPGNASQSAAGLMSSTDKTKLDGVASGAEVNVNADWTETDSSHDGYIENKPGNASQSAHGLMSSTDKTKLDGIETAAKDDQDAGDVATDTANFDGILSSTDTTVQAALETLDGITMLNPSDLPGEANVQADWDETDSSDDSYIQNKPGRATPSADGFMSNADKTKLDGIETKAKADQNANEVPVGTTNFDGVLSSSDNNVQAALETLDGITLGETNVRADWDETDSSDDSFIRNKPTDSEIGDKAFSNPPSDLSDSEKTAARTAIGAGTGSGDGEANVQADWNETDSSDDSFIQNKPTIPTIPGNASQSAAGLMSSADKTKLDGVEAGAKDDQSAAEVTVDTSSFTGNLGSSDTTVQQALETIDDLTTGSNQGEANVQSDWTETDTSADDYIKNKPGNATQTVSGFMASADKVKLDDIVLDRDVIYWPDRSGTIEAGTLAINSGGRVFVARAAIATDNDSYDVDPDTNSPGARNLWEATHLQNTHGYIDGNEFIIVFGERNNLTALEIEVGISLDVHDSFSRLMMIFREGSIFFATPSSVTLDDYELDRIQPHDSNTFTNVQDLVRITGNYTDGYDFRLGDDLVRYETLQSGLQDLIDGKVGANVLGRFRGTAHDLTYKGTIDGAGQIRLGSTAIAISQAKTSPATDFTTLFALNETVEAYVSGTPGVYRQFVITAMTSDTSNSGYDLATLTVAELREVGTLSFSDDDTVVLATTHGGGAGGTDDQNASEVSVGTDDFDVLSSDDDDVQAALEAIDEVLADAAYRTVENFPDPTGQAFGFAYKATLAASGQLRSTAQTGDGALFVVQDHDDPNVDYRDWFETNDIIKFVRDADQGTAFYQVNGVVTASLLVIDGTNYREIRIPVAALTTPAFSLSDGDAVILTTGRQAAATGHVPGLMSTADKTKLDGIAGGAEANVQADWNESDSGDDSFIQNKPTIPTIPGNASQSAAGLMSSTDKTKLDGVASGAEVNVNADWDASSGDAQILNKPTIPTIPGDASQSQAGLMSSADKTKLDGIETGAEVNPGDASQSAAGLMSAADKTKLDGVEANAKDDQDAGDVATDTANFDGILSSSDSSVQAALETLDAYVPHTLDEFVFGAAYSRNQIVRYQDVMYRARAAITAADEVPPLDTTNWAEISSHGIEGYGDVIDNADAHMTMDNAYNGALSQGSVDVLPISAVYIFEQPQTLIFRNADGRIESRVDGVVITYHADDDVEVHSSWNPVAAGTEVTIQWQGAVNNANWTIIKSFSGALANTNPDGIANNTSVMTNAQDVSFTLDEGDDLRFRFVLQVTSGNIGPGYLATVVVSGPDILFTVTGLVETRHVLAHGTGDNAGKMVVQDSTDDTETVILDIDNGAEYVGPTKLAGLVDDLTETEQRGISRKLGGPVPRFIYDALYREGDYARYGDTVYRALQDMTNATVIPPLDSTNWREMGTHRLEGYGLVFEDHSFGLSYSNVSVTNSVGSSHTTDVDVSAIVDNAVGVFEINSDDKAACLVDDVKVTVDKSGGLSLELDSDGRGDDTELEVSIYLAVDNGGTFYYDEHWRGTLSLPTGNSQPSTVSFTIASVYPATTYELDAGDILAVQVRTHLISGSIVNGIISQVLGEDIPFTLTVAADSRHVLAVGTGDNADKLVIEDTEADTTIPVLDLETGEHLGIPALPATLGDQLFGDVFAVSTAGADAITAVHAIQRAQGNDISSISVVVVDDDLDDVEGADYLSIWSVLSDNASRLDEPIGVFRVKSVTSERFTSGSQTRHRVHFSGSLVETYGETFDTGGLNTDLHLFFIEDRKVTHALPSHVRHSNRGKFPRYDTDSGRLGLYSFPETSLRIPDINGLWMDAVWGPVSSGQYGYAITEPGQIIIPSGHSIMAVGQRSSDPPVDYEEYLKVGDYIRVENRDDNDATQSYRITGKQPNFTFNANIDGETVEVKLLTYTVSSHGGNWTINPGDRMRIHTTRHGVLRVKTIDTNTFDLTTNDQFRRIACDRVYEDFDELYIEWTHASSSDGATGFFTIPIPRLLECVEIDDDTTVANSSDLGGSDKYLSWAGKSGPDDSIHGGVARATGLSNVAANQGLAFYQESASDDPRPLKVYLHLIR